MKVVFGDVDSRAHFVQVGNLRQFRALGYVRGQSITNTRGEDDAGNGTSDVEGSSLGANVARLLGKTVAVLRSRANVRVVKHGRCGPHPGDGVVGLRAIDLRLKWEVAHAKKGSTGGNVHPFRCIDASTSTRQ